MAGDEGSFVSEEDCGRVLGVVVAVGRVIRELWGVRVGEEVVGDADGDEAEDSSVP